MNLLVLLAFKSCVSFWFLRNSLLFQNLAGFEYFQAKEIAFCSVCTREPWDVLEDRRDKWDLDPGIVHLEIGRPGLTECTSVSNIQTNQILMTKQSKKVPTFSNMNLFFFWYLFIELSWVFVVEGRLYFPDQGSHLGLLHWELRVFTTGPPAKSPSYDILHFKYNQQFLWGKVDFSKLYVLLFYGLLLMWVTWESCAGSGS